MEFARGGKRRLPELIQGHFFVHQAQGPGLFGLDELAGEHEVQGVGQADDTGHALSARAAGQKAQFNLGQAQAHPLCGDAVMTGQGDFHAAAQAVAVYGRDDGLGGCLQGVQPAVHVH